MSDEIKTRTIRVTLDITFRGMTADEYEEEMCGEDFESEERPTVDDYDTVDFARLFEDVFTNELLDGSGIFLSIQETTLVSVNDDLAAIAKAEGRS